MEATSKKSKPLHLSELLKLIDTFCSRYPAAKVDHALLICFLRAMKSANSSMEEAEELGLLLEELNNFCTEIYRFHKANKKEFKKQEKLAKNRV